jgi:CTP synthase
MTIEFARNVLGLDKANSMEFDTNAEYPVISLWRSKKMLPKKEVQCVWCMEMCCKGFD